MHRDEPIYKAQKQTQWLLTMVSRRHIGEIGETTATSIKWGIKNYKSFA